MANELAHSLTGLRLSQNDEVQYMSTEVGYVNAVKFEAVYGASAYRNHIRIFVISHDGREWCLTERQSKLDQKDLPISAHELRVNRLILKDAYEYSNGFGAGRIQYGYDNRAMMYTSAPIQGSILEMVVEELLYSRQFFYDQRIRIEIGNDVVQDHELRSFYELLIFQNAFDSFGVHFSPCQMIRLGIRAKPEIASGTGIVKPDARTRFNLRGHRYIDPSECKKWMVLNGTQENIQAHIGKLMEEARNRGIALGHPEINQCNSRDITKENWTKLFEDLAEYGYEYVLIDMKKSRQAQTHHMLKCCELIFGIQTQQVHLEILKKYPCHENIVHKMNMKLDGLNYQIFLVPCSISPLFYDDKVFVLSVMMLLIQLNQVALVKLNHQLLVFPLMLVLSTSHLMEIISFNHLIKNQLILNF